MVLLLYRAVADAMLRSALPAGVRECVAGVIERILSEEETHLGGLDQHSALLDLPRGDLSEEAASMLHALRDLEDEDYRFPSERTVRQVVQMTSRYADAERYRAVIESAAAPQ